MRFVSFVPASGYNADGVCVERMAKFVVFFHFDRDHSLRQTIEAETVGDARARVFESVHDNGLVNAFEVRVEDNLFVIPLHSVRFIQIVEADRLIQAPQWNVG